MTNYAKIDLGFELSNDDYISDYTTIFNKAEAFMTSQPDGSTRKITSRDGPNGVYAHLKMMIVVEDIDEAKAKRTQVANALPTLPPLIVDENGKGWLFNYVENGIIIE